MKRMCIAMVLLMASTASMADDDGVPRRGPTGLSVFANAGAMWADDVSANFYSGRPSNANTIERVLHSNTYGTQIWTDLRTDGLISPAVGSYNELQVAEYPEMYYRTSYNIGLGLRYDYASGFGWLLRFDMARLEAIGAFNLSSNNGTGRLGSNQYVRCGMLGKEDRIYIDLALTRTVDIGAGLCVEVDLGLNLNNTKVRDNLMEINGSSFSILDVWGGRTPDAGVGDYEYVNQGGIGWGVFMSGYVGYRMEGVGAIKLGYTCHHSKTVLPDYTAMGWNHCLNLRFEINNFSFL
ncbi:MAG: hypothetical protein IJ745_06620 [Bacteroidales bacterium]|nr:hypothetical protein [Bacteroidales bacterium]